MGALLSSTKLMNAAQFQPPAERRSRHHKCDKALRLWSMSKPKNKVETQRPPDLSEGLARHQLHGQSAGTAHHCHSTIGR